MLPGLHLAFTGQTCLPCSGNFLDIIPRRAAVVKGVSYFKTRRSMRSFYFV